MTFITHHPVVLFAVSFLGLWAAAWLGATLKRRWNLDEDERQDFGVILAATLTLLGLLIGFSFSMAITRYDQRKVYEEAEANAIGTEYARADLLPAADAAKVRALLKRYTELRLRYYTADEAEIPRIDAETARLQREMWTAVLPPPSPPAPPATPVTALIVSGMNDVLNSQGYTQAAWWNRIPLSAALLMVTIALSCNLLLGFGLRSVRPRSWMLLILPLVVAVAFMLIDDIDTPRHGLIRVVPPNLMSLLASLDPR